MVALMSDSPKAGLHVRSKHKHKHKHKRAFLFLALVLVLASSRFTHVACLCLCLRRTCELPKIFTLHLLSINLSKIWYPTQRCLRAPTTPLRGAVHNSPVSNVILPGVRRAKGKGTGVKGERISPFPFSPPPFLVPSKFALRPTKCLWVSEDVHYGPSSSASPWFYRRLDRQRLLGESRCRPSILPGRQAVKGRCQGGLWSHLEQSENGVNTEQTNVETTQQKMGR